MNNTLKTLAEKIKVRRLLPVLILIVLWVLTLVPRVYWLTQKGALHNDEVTSIIYSEVNELGWSHHFRFDIPFPGKVIKEGFLLTDDTFSEMWSDIGKLWRGISDSFHLAPYFMFLRIAEGRLVSGDFHDFIPRAGALNLLFHSVSFFVFFLLMRRLFGQNRVLPYAAVFATFMSTAAISTTLLFRPYQLSQMALVLFAYFFVRYLQTEKLTRVTLSESGAAKYYINLKFIVLTPLVTAFALLSSLFSLTFVACVGLFAIIWCVCRRRYREIGAYALILMFAFGIAQIWYPSYLLNSVVPIVGSKLSSLLASAPQAAEGSVAEPALTEPNAASENEAEDGAAKIAEKTIFEQTMDSINAVRAIPSMLSQFYLYYWTLPVLIVMLLIISIAGVLYVTTKENAQRKKTWRDWLRLAGEIMLSPGFGLFVSAVLFVLFGIMAAAFKELRYGSPAYPFFIILPIALLSLIRDKRISAALAVLLALSFTVYDFSEPRVPNVWRNYAETLYRFTKEPNIPAFIIADSNHFPLLLPYLADNQMYVFNNRIYPTFQKFNYPEFYLIINDPIIELNPIDSNFWTIEESYKVGVNIDLWTVGKLKRIVDPEIVAATLSAHEE